MSTPEEQYLADVARLQKQCENLPYVTQKFMLEVASMSREELQRRILNGSDTIGHCFSALDKIPEIRCMPGAGIDGCRSHNEVRNIVTMLVKHCPITWEKTWEGRKKNE